LGALLRVDARIKIDLHVSQQGLAASRENKKLTRCQRAVVSSSRSDQRPVAELVYRDAQAAFYRLPLPTPYPVGDVNCYLIMGPEVGLIDAGCLTSESQAALHGHLAELGLTPEAVRTIAITHHHPDHIGGAGALCQSGAALVLPRRTVDQRQIDPEASQVMLQFLLSLGAPATRVEAWRRFEEATLDRVTDHPRQPAPGAGRKPGPASCTIEDGATIAVGGVELHALATPGHALDHFCYIDSSRSIAFTGDHLLPTITPNPVLAFDVEQGYQRRHSLVEYMASLDRLARLAPRLALGGHGGPVADPAALIVKNLEFIAERGRRYLAMIATGECVPVFELGRRIFGDRDDANMFLATSETVGYLDLLQDQGKIEVVERAGILCVTASR